MFLLSIRKVPVSVLSNVPVAVPSLVRITAPIPKLSAESETPLNKAPTGKTPAPEPATLG
jgi:hypothetical protein